MGDAAWLTAERARAWSRVLAAMSAAAVVLWCSLSQGGLDPLGKPLGTDFISFWAASRLALGGDPASAYWPEPHRAAELALFPSDYVEDGYTAFFYPPAFLLLCLPLALLPYFAALATWLAAGFAAWFGCVRRVLPQRWAIVPIAAFPAVLVEAAHGQNGFLTGACLGAAMLNLERRPFLAGLCLGTLVFKPQLLLATPPVLLAARRWSALAGALVSASVLCAASWAAFGGATWRSFFAVAPLARATLERGLVDPGKMQSVYAAVRVLGAGGGMAYAAQAVTVLATWAALAATAARRPGGRAEGAMLVAATTLCTPFLFDYDLVCVALPIAWVAREATRTGWWRWEKTVLLGAYLLPLVSRPLALGAGLPLGPAVLAALFWVVVRRARGRGQGE